MASLVAIKANDGTVVRGMVGAKLAERFVEVMRDGGLGETAWIEPSEADRLDWERKAELAIGGC